MVSRRKDRQARARHVASYTIAAPIATQPPPLPNQLEVCKQPAGALTEHNRGVGDDLGGNRQALQAPAGSSRFATRQQQVVSRSKRVSSITSPAGGPDRRTFLQSHTRQQSASPPPCPPSCTLHPPHLALLHRQAGSGVAHKRVLEESQLDQAHDLATTHGLRGVHQLLDKSM